MDACQCETGSTKQEARKVHCKTGSTAGIIYAVIHEDEADVETVNIEETIFSAYERRACRPHNKCCLTCSFYIFLSF